MGRFRLRPLFCAILFVAVASGCAHSNQGEPLSANDQQKREQVSKQAEIDVKSAQINSSNLPPDQKQHLLEQLRANSGK